MSTAYLVTGTRTPIGRYGGALAPVRPDDLAAHVVGALIATLPAVDWAAVDDVILGSANQAGEDNRNVARMAVLLAGLPVEVAAGTVNRLCGSGLDAVAIAARAVRAGDADLVIAGEVESMTRAPFVTGGAAWESLGHAIAAYEIALAYAQQRVQFGKPIASFQLVQHKLVTMLAEITSMQLYCFRMAQLQEQGRFTGPMASLAKMNHAQKARQVCLDARDILGGNGLLLEHHVARHLTDMEVVHTYEGTDSIQSLIVGRDITGISAFS